MCSKGCGLYFSKGFFIRNNYVGSGFQAELEASSRFILFFLSIISFPFFFIDSLACFYYSSRSGTIIEKVEKLKFRITFVAIIIILQLLLLLYYIRRINYRSNLDS